MTGKVQGHIWALGLISESRKGFLVHKSTKLSLEVSVLNSSSIAGWPNVATLQTVHEGGRGSLPSGMSVQLSTQSLKV
jgi:hypothetical protein